MENEDNLKAQFLKEKHQFELEKIAWNRIQIERSNEMKTKLEKLLKIQNNLNSFENFPSNKFNNKDEEKSNNLKLEIDKLKYEYKTKLSELEKLKNNLIKEKSNFENYAYNIKNEIKNKQNIIEKENSNIIKKDNELEERIINLNRKENDLKNKKEELEKLKNFILNLNEKNLKDEKDLEKAEFKKNIFYNSLLEEENNIENEKKKINEEIDNIERDKIQIINDKKEIEEIKKDINLRMKCMDELCSKNIIQDFDSFYINYKKDDDNKNQSLNGGDLDRSKSSFNPYDKFDKYKINNYNSELYLLKIKNRIDLNKIKLYDKYENKKFDLAKEQKYLEKSYESLKKIKK